MQTKRNNVLAVSAISLAIFFGLTGESCEGNDSTPTANQREQAQQARQQDEGNSAVGPVSILNWTQKRQFKAILEAFDQPNLITYSYLFSNYTGKLVPLCRSQGYGFNEATQYTNPTMGAWHNYDQGTAGITLAQQDPNGLYSPTNSPGTLLLCLTTTVGKVMPVRSEPDIITLPVPYDQLDRTGM